MSDHKSKSRLGVFSPLEEVDGKNGEEPGENKESWLETLIKAARTSTQLQVMEIKPREPMIGDWLKEGDLGFIFAVRGVGKTWFGMDLARALADGKNFGPWPAHGVRNVAYFDGEMPPGDIKQRDTGLGDPKTNLTYVNHEILFQETGRVLNLADRETQVGIRQFCLQGSYKVLILDNLSTLAPGARENEGDDWGLLLAWLLELRRHQITIIFIHHAGRNNQMRGHSRREDTCSWIIRLGKKTAEIRSSTGAVFISSFEKNRNCPSLPSPCEWCYEPDGDKTRLTIKQASNLDVFREHVVEGIDSATDIASEMGISKGYAAKLAKQGVEKGWLKICNGKYKMAEGSKDE